MLIMIAESVLIRLKILRHLANAGIKVMFYGITRGTFTGKRLADYFDGGVENWVGARQIINGTDSDLVIAGYGRAYYAALSYTTG